MEFGNGSRAEQSSDLEAEWNLEQWKCEMGEMGCPLTVPSFHLGHVVGACNCIQPSLLFGIYTALWSVYHNIQEC